MLIQELKQKGLIHPPSWLPTNIQYLTIMGSVAYGVSSDTSDMDIYGFAIPPKDEVFPHLRGEIPGFGKQKQRFEQWQEHHVYDASSMGGMGREYDFQVFSIVKMFNLCMDCNPNMIDALFTPQNCVLHCTKIGAVVRDNRRKFLHKGAWHRFKRYAYSQLHKISEPAREAVHGFEAKHGLGKTCNMSERLHEVNQYSMGLLGDRPLFQRLRDTAVPKLSNGTGLENLLQVYQSLLERGNQSPKGKRKALVDKYGYDVKFAYHVVRLLSEVEQIMAEGDLNLQRNNEQLKAIRRGEWSEDRLRKWAADQEARLEEVYAKSELPHGPDEEAIKALLMECLEIHYGSLKDAVVQQDAAVVALRNIQKELDKVGSLLSA